jgi:uncharacterized damage-inducible protein DinB
MIDPFVQELEQEATTTRKLLLRVPTEQLGWKPHAKARSLGQLAHHISVSQGRVATAIQTPTFNLGGGEGTAPESSEEIVANFDTATAEAKRLLAGMTDEDLGTTWQGQVGGKTVFAAPKIAVVRAILLNHIYHHRGQLSVYLRQLDVALPSVYGPTADENPFV